MKNSFIKHPIPKQLIRISSIFNVLVVGLIICNSLKAAPVSRPSVYDDHNCDNNNTVLQLSCKGNIQVSLDASGQAVLTPKMLLTDNYINYGVFKVFVNQTSSNKVYCSDIGKTIVATVLDTTNGMMCWTNVKVEDKLMPQITCPGDTISCSNNPFEVNYSQFVLATDNCQTHAMTVADMRLEQFNCLNPRYTMVMHLNWIATDNSGNSSTCAQDIYFKKASVDSITFPPNDTVYCPNPDLNSTGVPLLFNDTVSHLCNLVVGHLDDSILVCGGMYKVNRRWTVVDWCNKNFRSHTQEILISDTTKPVIQCVNDTLVFTRYNACTLSYTIQAGKAFDVCSGTSGILFAVRVDSSFVVVPGSTITLDIGIHSLDYIAFDPCGNSDTCTAYVEVRDRISPTMICPPGLIVSLDPRGEVEVTAEYIAARGLVQDNCCIDTLLIRRMTVACGQPSDTIFSDEVKFCCDDIQDTVMLVLKATDCSGNMNFCMIEVYVQDKNPVAPPQCPDDIELSCAQDYNDLELTGNYFVISSCLDSIQGSHADEVSLDSCKNGEVRRKFYITYPDGTVDSSCIQLITILNYYRFDEADIIWPGDTTVPACSNISPTGLQSFPVNPADTCGSVYFSFTDLNHRFTADSCQVLPRLWEAYSACTQETVFDTQFITLVDLSHSKLTIPRDTTLRNGTDSCSRFVKLVSAKLSGCGTFAKITNSFNNGGADASGVYPLGINKVIFTAKDSCNILKDTLTIIILDQESPSTICKILNLNMNPNDTIKLTARGLLEEYDDNCTPKNKLLISFSSTNFTDTCRYITCADLPSIPDTFIYTIYVKDSSGNKGNCLARVHVFDPNNHCTTALRTGDVSGLVRCLDGTVMPGVQVELEGYGGSRMTDNSGHYLFQSIQTNLPYVIVPRYNEGWPKGISTQDIVMLQRHILGIEELSNPYQWIAADVDRNERLTTADITWMRKLILGKVTEVPNNESWRFIDETYHFSNQQNPLQGLNNNSSSMVGFWQDTLVNYRSIKIGDISAQTLLKDIPSVERMRKVKLKVYDQSFGRGDLITLDLKLDKTMNLEGMQLHLWLNTRLLELYKVEWMHNLCGARPLSSDEYQYEEGQLKVSGLADTGCQLWDAGETLLRMTVRGLGNGKLSQVIGMGSQLQNEMIPQGNVPVPLLLEFENELAQESELLSWQADPNPFIDRCQLSFESGERGIGELILFDLSGKQILSRVISYNKGINSLWIESSELPSEGTYIYYFKTNRFNQQGSIMRIQK